MLSLKLFKPRAPKDDYEAFYKQRVVSLIAYLRRFGLQNKEDMEDVLQETFVQAYQSWQSLEQPEAELAWLFTIARRQVFRLFENKKKHLACNDEETRYLVQELASPRASASPEVSLETKRLFTEICDAILEIPDEAKRTALQLFFIDCVPLKEIAVATQTPISTLTTWCARFREKMRSKS